MRNVFVCVSLAALLVAGCGEITGGGGKSETAQADPAQVAPEDLRAAVKDERVRKLYEARGWTAVWSEPLAQELTAALGEA